MNDDLEKRLRDIHLAPPSADLERRIKELFVAGTSDRPAARRIRWWWLALPAAGTIVASIFLMSRPNLAPPPIQPVIYQIEAKGLMREWLLTPPPESLAPPKMIVSVDR